MGVAAHKGHCAGARNGVGTALPDRRVLRFGAAGPVAVRVAEVDVEARRAGLIVVQNPLARLVGISAADAMVDATGVENLAIVDEGESDVVDGQVDLGKDRRRRCAIRVRAGLVRTLRGVEVVVARE